MNRRCLCISQHQSPSRLPLNATQPDWQIYLDDPGTGGLPATSAVGSINGRDAYVLQTDHPFPREEWVHTALTYDGQVLRLFKNGVEIDATPHTEALNESGTPLYIGNRFRELGDTGYFQGVIDEVQIYDAALPAERIAALVCDLDGDVILGVGDIDLLREAVHTGATKAAFDVTRDGLVNFDDIHLFVTDANKLNSWIGDANLDGEFSSGDMVQVFQSGKYELDIETGWADGDWTADGRFTSGDLVAAFQDGGYEFGPRTAVRAVPEPSSASLILIGTIGLYRGRKRR